MPEFLVLDLERQYGTLGGVLDLKLEDLGSNPSSATCDIGQVTHWAHPPLIKGSKMLK